MAAPVGLRWDPADITADGRQNVAQDGTLRLWQRSGRARVYTVAVEESGSDGASAIETVRAQASRDDQSIPRPPAHQSSCRFRRLLRLGRMIVGGLPSHARAQRPTLRRAACSFALHAGVPELLCRSCCSQQSQKDPPRAFVLPAHTCLSTSHIYAIALPQHSIASCLPRPSHLCSPPAHHRSRSATPL